MRKDIIDRLLELISEDEQLHTAVIEYVEALTRAEQRRAAWYLRRTKE